MAPSKTKKSKNVRHRSITDYHQGISYSSKKISEWGTKYELEVCRLCVWDQRGSRTLQNGFKSGMWRVDFCPNRFSRNLENQRPHILLILSSQNYCVLQLLCDRGRCMSNTRAVRTVFVMEKDGLGTHFLRALWYSRVKYHCNSVQYFLHLSTLHEIR